MKTRRKHKTHRRKPAAIDEQTDWLSLSPAKRIQETTKLWQLYIALGGSLDAEPDPQSPFYDIMQK